MYQLKIISNKNNNRLNYGVQLCVYYARVQNSAFGTHARALDRAARNAGLSLVETRRHVCNPKDLRLPFSRDILRRRNRRNMEDCLDWSIDKSIQGSVAAAMSGGQ